MSKLHFKYGAMNCGKSDTLIKTAYNYGERGLKVLVIKPTTDTKSTNILTRAGLTWNVDIAAEPSTNLLDAVLSYIKTNKIDKVHCILLDESQFLTEAQVDQLYELAKRHDISVIAYGLRDDFTTKLFEGSKRLFELADNIEELPAMCRCGSQAKLNARKVNGTFVFSGEQVAIDQEHLGGEVTYEALCGTCYLDEKAKAAA